MKRALFFIAAAVEVGLINTLRWVTSELKYVLPDRLCFLNYGKSKSTVTRKEQSSINSVLNDFAAMMSIMDTDWQEIPDSSLGERDANVLQLIGQEELTGFTFDGLKRRLGLHPETLSRILFRLEDRGIVKKELRGYRVTSKIKSALTSYPLSSIKPSVPILQTMLSPDVPVRQVVLDLRGKWFGMLRWLGYSENSNSVTLKWITEDGGVQIDANFLDNQLSIEARLLHEKDLNIALKASYQLISYITRFYSGHIRIRHVAYPANFKPYFMLA